MKSKKINNPIFKIERMPYQTGNFECAICEKWSPYSTGYFCYVNDFKRVIDYPFYQWVCSSTCADMLVLQKIK